MKSKNELYYEFKELVRLYSIDTNSFLDTICNYMSTDELAELVDYFKNEYDVYYLLDNND